MEIFVRAKSNSKQEKIEAQDDTHFIIWVKAPPRENKANEEILRLLGEYFSIPHSRLAIIRGANSKNKIIAIT